MYDDVSHISKISRKTDPIKQTENLNNLLIGFKQAQLSFML